MISGVLVGLRALGAASRRPASSAAFTLAWVFDRGDECLHDFLHRAVFQRADCGGVQLHIDIVFFNERLDDLERHGARDDVDAVRPFVRGDFHFADDDIVLSRPDAGCAAIDLDGNIPFAATDIGISLAGEGTSIGSGDCPLHPWWLAGLVGCRASLLGLFKELLQRSDDVFRFGVFQRHKLAHDFGWSHVDGPNDADECADERGVLRDEQCVRLWKRDDAHDLIGPLH